jgi:RNA polymerase sigma-70 factor (ECF subfamily)
MASTGEFHRLIERVRRGDPDAAACLVRQYEPVIRRAIRFRLTDSRLRAAFDSMDVCQSVLGSFFVRAAHGQYDLDGPEDLTRLLVGIARNKLATQARRQGADKRDFRRVEADASVADVLAGSEPSPSRFAAAKELLQAVRNRLTPDEWQIVELRHQGLVWAEIADRTGETAVNLRKRFSRVMDRVTKELDLDDGAE